MHGDVIGDLPKVCIRSCLGPELLFLLRAPELLLRRLPTARELIHASGADPEGAPIIGLQRVDDGVLETAAVTNVACAGRERDPLAGVEVDLAQILDRDQVPR